MKAMKLSLLELRSQSKKNPYIRSLSIESRRTYLKKRGFMLYTFRWSYVKVEI
jgi:hypothetical protein